MIPKTISLLAASWLSACSYVTSVPIGADDTEEAGIRYNAMRPILIISGGKANIEYIPDPSREFALRYGAFLAKNKTKFTLTDQGALKTIESDLDGTGPISGLFQIANKLVDDALKESADVVSGKVEGTGDVVIFDFVFAEDGTLVGLKKLSKVELGDYVSQNATGKPLDGKSEEPDLLNPGTES